jgi:transposase-like protein
MPVGQHTDPVIKSQIITKIRDEGVSVSEASALYDVNSKTIYRWLKEGVVNGNANLILENNRLRKENEQLYNLLGRATAENKRSKR